LHLAACLVVLALPAETAWAQEGQGGRQVYPGDLGQAIAAILIFLGLLAILGRWAWKPVVGQLKRREESIAQALERSQQREQEARDLLAQYTARLQAADAEAQEVIARGRHEAAAAREELLTQARQEAQKFIAEAKEDLRHAKQMALQELYVSTAKLSADIAAQLLGRVLSSQDQDRLLNGCLQEIGKAFRQEE
jgi:F-type H+-transporting ATPase subunit b